MRARIYFRERFDQLRHALAHERMVELVIAVHVGIDLFYQRIKH